MTGGKILFRQITQEMGFFHENPVRSGFESRLGDWWEIKLVEGNWALEMWKGNYQE